ncbi:MAG: PAS domain S-box protein [Desulfobacteraceae bacterium]|nr:MAG: PAS domain S-box protein [Desulfobacteraceae bacterium]
MVKIKTKVIFILIGVFFGFAAIDYGVQHVILFPGFLEIEKDRAVENTKRITQAITNELDHLDTLCHDWSAWDATYTYAADPSDAYIEENLPESVFDDNKLSYIGILNTDRKVLYHQAMDLSEKRKITIGRFPDDVFPESHPLLTYSLAGKSLSEVTIKGILMTDKGPMLISSRPILANSNEGPIRGSMIMGRLFNGDMVRKIREQTRIHFSLYPILPESIPSALQGIPSHITQEAPYFIQAAGEDLLRVYTVIKELEGKPFLLLEVNNSREISTKGTDMIGDAFLLKIALSITIVLILLMLQQAVFKKIEKLTNHVQSIQQTGDLSKRIETAGRDEINVLANEFNRLLEKLHEKTEKSKEFEDELQNSERKFRTIIENAPGVVFILDLSGDLLLFEGKGVDVLGLQPNQVTGQSIFTIFHDQPETIRNIQKAMAGNTFTVDIAVRKLIFATTFAPYRDRTGELIGTIGIATNITERKMAEEALRESENQFRSIVENSHDGIILIGADYKFQYVNDEFCKITGRSYQELIGEDFRVVLDDESKDLVADRYKRRQMGEAVPPRYEFNILRKTGEKRRIEFSGNVIRDSNGRVETVGQLLDITRNKESEEERQRLEMKLRQAQKMEAIGTLAGGIAHDFNNILSAIMGYAQLALMNSQRNDKVHQYIQQLMASSERAKSLVQQILAFSRQTKVERIPVDIGMVFKEVLKLIRPTTPSTIEITHNVVSNLGAVMADQTQIHQVLMNLCVNASQAMEENGGELRVELFPVELTAADVVHYTDIEPGRYLLLTVKDTGMGMDEETMSHIFEPYFTTKRISEGTGMGLATVHGIVTDCGGDIRVSSKPGAGTTFHVLFPVIEKEIPEVENSILDLPSGNEQVLFVDDEKFLVDIGIEMLNDLGYKVEGRTSSHDALEAFRANPDKYDIVITDMTMPEMTGDKLAMEIKKIRSDIPIIICSGFSREMTQEKAQRIGVRSFLNKPITMEEMAQTIRKELDRK